MSTLCTRMDKEQNFWHRWDIKDARQSKLLQKKHSYLQGVQCDTMDKSRCVVVERVLGGFALLHPMIIALLDAIPDLRCRRLVCNPWHNHSLPDNISLSDMHLLEISHKIIWCCTSFSDFTSNLSGQAGLPRPAAFLNTILLKAMRKSKWRSVLLRSHHDKWWRVCCN